MVLRMISNITVNIHKKKIKNMNIRVASDLRVHLSVPMKTSDYVIKEFTETKRKWISALVKLKNTSTQRHSKDTMSVLGVSYKIHSCTDLNPICRIIDKENIMVAFPDSYSCCKKETFIKEWYRSILKSIVPDILKKWQDTTGMHCSEWQTRQMRTRWGSCNTQTKKIWLSVKLAKKSLPCIEFVVLHELTHTVVPNHGPDFKAILDKYMPDWRERKKLLNSDIISE